MNARENAIHQRVAVPPLDDERRRHQRIHLQIPLFIRGKDTQGEQFMELAKTLDISAIGAFVASPRPLDDQRIYHPDDSRAVDYVIRTRSCGHGANSGARSGGSKKPATCTLSASSS